MDVGGSYDYSNALLLMEPFENPLVNQPFIAELPETYGKLWQFKQNIVAWSFAISKYKDYVYLLYRAENQTTFLPLKQNEKVSVIEEHHNNYIVIVLREVADDGRLGDHCHSLVLDIRSDHARFDMAYLLKTLEDSQVMELVTTFEASKYLPWIDGNATVIARRLNNIWGGLDRYAIRHVQEVPAIGAPSKPKRRKSTDPGLPRSAATASGSGATGQG